MSLAPLVSHSSSLRYSPRKFGPQRPLLTRMPLFAKSSLWSPVSPSHSPVCVGRACEVSARLLLSGGHQVQLSACEPPLPNSTSAAASESPRTRCGICNRKNISAHKTQHKYGWELSNGQHQHHYCPKPPARNIHHHHSQRRKYRLYHRHT